MKKLLLILSMFIVFQSVSYSQVKTRMKYPMQASYLNQSKNFNNRFTNDPVVCVKSFEQYGFKAFVFPFVVPYSASKDIYYVVPYTVSKTATGGSLLTNVVPNLICDLSNNLPGQENLLIDFNLSSKSKISMPKLGGLEDPLGYDAFKDPDWDVQYLIDAEKVCDIIVESNVFNSNWLSTTGSGENLINQIVIDLDAVNPSTYCDNEIINLDNLLPSFLTSLNDYTITGTGISHNGTNYELNTGLVGVGQEGFNVNYLGMSEYGDSPFTNSAFAQKTSTISRSFTYEILRAVDSEHPSLTFVSLSERKFCDGIFNLFDLTPDEIVLDRNDKYKITVTNTSAGFNQIYANGNSNASTSLVVNNLPAGTYTVVFEYTDQLNNNCNNPAAYTTTFEIEAKPFNFISTNAFTICNSSGSFNLTTLLTEDPFDNNNNYTGNNGTFYLIENPYNILTSVPVAQGSQILFDPSVYNHQNGYTVLYDYENDVLYCDFRIEKQIYVQNTQNIIVKDDTLCVSNSIEAFDLFDVLEPNVGDDIATWHYVNSIPPGAPAPNMLSTQFVELSSNDAGKHIFEIRTATGLCKDTTQVTLTINANPFVSAVNDTFCMPKTMNNSLLISGAYGSPSGGYWTDINENSLINDPVNESIGSVDKSYIYTYTNSYGCFNKDTNNVSFYARPEIRIYTDEIEICEDEILNLEPYIQVIDHSNAYNSDSLNFIAYYREFYLHPFNGPTQLAPLDYQQGNINHINVDSIEDLGFNLTDEDTYSWYQGYYGDNSPELTTYLTNTYSAGDTIKRYGYNLVYTDGNGCSADAPTYYDYTNPNTPFINGVSLISQPNLIKYNIPKSSMLDKSLCLNNGIEIYDTLNVYTDLLDVTYSNNLSLDLTDSLRIDPLLLNSNNGEIIYEYMVSPKGCISIDSFGVNVLATPTKPTSNDTTTLTCAKSDLTITIDNTSYTTIWYDINENQIDSNVLTYTHEVEKDTFFYAIHVDDLSGCISEERNFIAQKHDLPEVYMQNQDIAYCEDEIIDLTSQINNIKDYEIVTGYVPANVSFYATDKLIGFQSGVPVDQVYQTTGLIDETNVNIDSLEALGYNLSNYEESLDSFSRSEEAYELFLQTMNANQIDTITFYGIHYIDDFGCEAEFEYYAQHNGNFQAALDEMSAPKFTQELRPTSAIPDVSLCLNNGVATLDTAGYYSNPSNVTYSSVSLINNDTQIDPLLLGNNGSEAVQISLVNPINGCTSKDTFDIDILATPVIPITASTNIEACYGEEISIAVNTGSNTAKWYAGTNNFSSLNTISLTVTNDTSFVIQAENNNNCKSEGLTIIIKMNKLPEIFMQDDSVFYCEDAVLNLNAQINNITDYQMGTGFNANNVSFFATNMLIGKQAGTPVNQVQSTTGALNHFNVNVDSLVSAGYDLTGSSAALDAYANGDAAYQTYLNTFGSNQTEVVTFYGLQYTDAKGCEADFVSYYSYDDGSFLPSISELSAPKFTQELRPTSAMPDVSLCLNNGLVTLDTAGYYSNPSNVTYSSVSLINNDTQIDPLLLGNNGNEAVQISLLNPINGCTSKDTFDIEVLTTPLTPTTTSTNIEACYGEEINISVNTGSNTAKWYAGTNNFSAANSISLTVTNDTSFVIQAENNNNCKSEGLTIIVKMNKLPEFYMQNDSISYCENEIISLNPQINNIIDYQLGSGFNANNVSFFATNRLIGKQAGTPVNQVQSTTGALNHLAVNIDSLISAGYDLTGSSAALDAYANGDAAYQTYLNTFGSNQTEVVTFYGLQYVDSKGCEADFVSYYSYEDGSFLPSISELSAPKFTQELRPTSAMPDVSLCLNNGLVTLDTAGYYSNPSNVTYSSVSLINNDTQIDPLLLGNNGNEAVQISLLNPINGCTSKDTFDIEVLTTPLTPTTTSTNIEACYGEEINIAVNTGSNTAKWYAGTNNFSSANSISLTVTNDTSFVIQAENNNNCKSEGLTINVTMNKLPEIYMQDDSIFYCQDVILNLSPELNNIIDYQLGSSFNVNNVSFFATNRLIGKQAGTPVNQVQSTTGALNHLAVNIDSLISAGYDLTGSSAALDAYANGQVAYQTYLNSFGINQTEIVTFYGLQYVDSKGCEADFVSYYSYDDGSFLTSVSELSAPKFNQALKPTSTMPDVSVCLNNDTVALDTAGYYSTNVNVVYNSISINNNNDIIAATLGANGSENVIETFTDIQTGCVNTDSFLINIQPTPPKPTLADNAIDACENENISISVTNGTPFIKKWFQNGSLISSNNTLDILVTQYGEYEVLNENSVTGCKSETDTFSVISNTPPKIFMQEDSIFYCQDDVLNLNSQINRIDDYVLGIGNNFNPNNVSFFATNMLIGKQSGNPVNQVQSTTGALDHFAVNVDSLVSAGYNLTGSSAALDAYANGQAAYQTYLNSFGINQTEVVTFYGLQYTDSKGCEADFVSYYSYDDGSFLTSVSELSAPKFNQAVKPTSTMPDVSVCLNNDTLALDTAGNYSTQVNAVYNSISINNNNEIIAAALGVNGTETVIETFTDVVTGCVNTDSFDITIQPTPPKPTLADNSIDACENENISVSVTNGTPFIKKWFQNGSLISSNNTLDILVTQYGEYEVLNENSVTGCKSETDTFSVISNKPPEIFMQDDSIFYCQDDVLNLNTQINRINDYDLGLGNNFNPNNVSFYATNMLIGKQSGNPINQVQSTTGALNHFNVNVDSLVSAGYDLTGSSAALDAYANGQVAYQTYLNSFGINQTEIVTFYGLQYVDSKGCEADFVSYYSYDDGSFLTSVSELSAPKFNQALKPTSTMPDISVCLNNDTVALDTAGYYSTNVNVVYNSISINNNNDIIAATLGANGSENVIETFTDIQTGCVNTDSFLINIQPTPPKPTLADNAIDACENENISINVTNGTPFIKKWYQNGTLISSNNTLDILVTQYGEYEVLNENSVTGCKSETDTFSVISNKPPEIFMQDDSIFYCQDDVLNLNTQINRINDYDLGLGNNFNANNVSFYATNMLIGKQSGNPINQVQSTTGALNHFNVNVDSLVSAGYDLTGSSAALDAYANGQVAYQTYLNSFGINQTEVVTFYGLQYTDAKGCEADFVSYYSYDDGSFLTSVSELSAPKFNQALKPTSTMPDVSVCLNNDTLALDTAGYYSTNVNVVYNSISINNNNDIIAATLGANGSENVIETFTDIQTGCVNTDSFLINIKPTPPKPILADNAIDACENENISISVTNGAPYTKKWYQNGALISSNNTLDILVTQYGEYEVLNENSVTGCKSKKDTFTVTSRQAPIIYMQDDSISYCENEIIDLTPQVNNITDYNLGVGNGYDANNLSFVSTNMLIGKQIGQPINQVQSTTGSINYTAVNIDSLEAEGYNLTQEDQHLEYFAIGGIVYQNYLNSFGPNQTDVVTFYGLEYTDAYGCKADFKDYHNYINGSFLASVSELSSPKITKKQRPTSAMPDVSLCLNNGLVNLDTTGYYSNPSNVTYSSISLINNDAQIDPLLLGNNGSEAVQISLVNPVNGCTNKDTFDIDVLPTPLMPTTANTNIEACYGEEISIAVNSGTNTAKWYAGSNNFSSANSITLTVTNDTSFVVQAENNDNCKSDGLTINIAMNKLPEVYMQSDSIFYCEGEALNLNNQINNIIDYDLGVGNGFTSSNVSFYATNRLIGKISGNIVDQVQSTTGAINYTNVNIDSLEIEGYNLTIPTTHLDIYAEGGTVYQNYLNGFSYNQTDVETFYGLQYTDAKGCTSDYESFYTYDDGSFVQSISELSSPQFIKGDKPTSTMPNVMVCLNNGLVTLDTVGHYSSNISVTYSSVAINNNLQIDPTLIPGGIETVTEVVTNNETGCHIDRTFILSLDVTPPAPMFTDNIYEVCSGDSLSITPTNLGSGYSTVWINSSVGSINGNNLNIQVNGNSITNSVNVGTSANGCLSDYTQFSIVKNDLPEIYMQDDTITYCQDDVLNLRNQVNTIIDYEMGSGFDYSNLSFYATKKLIGNISGTAVNQIQLTTGSIDERYVNIDSLEAVGYDFSNPSPHLDAFSEGGVTYQTYLSGFSFNQTEQVTFYGLDYTDGNGCKASFETYYDYDNSTFTTAVDQLTTPKFIREQKVVSTMPDVSLCLNNGLVNLDTTGYYTYPNNISYNSISLINNDTQIDPLLLGNDSSEIVEISLVNPINGCTSIDSFEINILGTPTTPTTANTNIEACFGEEITINVNSETNNNQWYAGNNNFNSSNSITLTITNDTSFIVYAENNIGCYSDPLEIFVTKINLPEIYMQSDSVFFCEQDLLNLVGQLNNIIDYDLGVGNGFIPNNLSFVATNMLIGNQFGVPINQIQSTTGLIDEMAVNIDSLENLGYNLTQEDIHLDYYAIGGTVYQNYLNTFGPNQTEVVTFYGLEYTDNNGCTSEFVDYHNYTNGNFLASVSELSSPKFVPGTKPTSTMPDLSVCLNNDTLALDTAGYYSTNVSVVYNSISINNNNNIIATALGANGSETVIETFTDNETGCIGIDSFDINILATPPKPNLVDNSIDACENENISVSVNNGTPYTQKWYQNGSLISSNNTLNILVTQYGEYEVLNENSVSGCKSLTDTFTITNRTPPEIYMQSDSVFFCEQDLLNLSNQINNIIDYDLGVGNGFNPNNVSFYATNMLIGKQFGAPINQIQSTTGLIDETSVNIDSLENLGYNLTQEDIHLDYYSIGGTVYQNYLNTFGPNQTDVVTFYGLHYEDSYGCEADFVNYHNYTNNSFLASVSELSSPKFVPGTKPTSTMPDVSVCLNNDTIILDTTNYSTNVSVVYSSISINNNNEIIAASLGANGSETVIETFTDNETGCIGIDSFDINILATPPKPILVDNSIDACENENISVSVNNGTPYTQKWYQNGSLISSNNTLDILVTQYGEYEVINENTSNGCISVKDTFSVTNRQVPVIYMQEDTLSYCEGTIINLTNQINSITDYSMSAGYNPNGLSFVATNKLIGNLFGVPINQVQNTTGNMNEAAINIDSLVNEGYQITSPSLHMEYYAIGGIVYQNYLNSFGPNYNEVVTFYGLEYVDSFGCKANFETYYNYPGGTFTASVSPLTSPKIINEALPISNTQDLEICLNNGIIDLDTAGNYSNISSLILNGNAINANNEIDPLIIGNGNSEFIVEQMISANGACSSTDSFKVSILATPPLPLASDLTYDVCKGEIVSTEILDDNYNAIWLSDDGAVISTADELNYQVDGDTIITVVQQDATTNCLSEENYITYNDHSPTGYILVDDTVQEADPTLFQVANSSNIVSYDWNVGPSGNYIYHSAVQTPTFYLYSDMTSGIDEYEVQVILTSDEPESCVTTLYKDIYVINNIKDNIYEVLPNNISIYPNPIKNTLYLEGEVNSLIIKDVIGKELLNIQENNITKVSFENISSGTYFVIINNKYISKLIKK